MLVILVVLVLVVMLTVDFECWFWLNVGDIGGVGIGCNINSEFCSSSLVHRHN